ncbi:hypothetical protein O181_125661, partial [Austropuccinia psidii MF-1]|nr:hypothetical protein [Austropuccinia psidii MF-1]
MDVSPIQIKNQNPLLIVQKFLPPALSTSSIMLSRNLILRSFTTILTTMLVLPHSG